ncbi:tail assembly protein [Stenotrophomonas sp. 278]|uniref:tail assembly protein n=1 Tax=Stenotrophomonas sp. 278 TaxID=2479851 RepID=UPI000F662A19|nr:tail assembly protein [Stenotrophomonas sp. 278]RRU23568.1 tail assembly protein [Stenotrophomonas sp. 278]
MTERVRTVRLYGVLGARFGREFQLAVGSAREAAYALSVMLPGFRQFMEQAKSKGMEFAVFLGRTNLRPDQIDDPPGDDVIRIAPVMVGSKRGGVLQTVLGIVLIVIGVVLNVYTGVSGTPLINLGVSMVIGGVVQMLSPQPKGLGAQDSVENRPSYSMNGTVNTQAQGNPVPYAFGGDDVLGMLVGSAVISGGIMAEDQQ